MTNPLDIGDIYDMSTYPGIVEMMLKEEGIDGVVFVSAHSAESDNAQIERLIREAARMSPLYGKPVVLCMVSSRDRWFALKEAADIPVFSDVDDALYALSWSLAHSGYQVEKGLTGPWEGGGAQKNGSPGSSVIMDPGETFALLERHGLPVAAYALAASAEEAAGLAERLGYPVAVKIASPNLLHKTEKGAVALDLKDAGAVRQASEPHGGGALSCPEDGATRLRGDRGRKAGQGIRTGRDIRSRRHLRGAAPGHVNPGGAH